MQHVAWVGIGTNILEQEEGVRRLWLDLEEELGAAPPLLPASTSNVPQLQSRLTTSTPASVLLTLIACLYLPLDLYTT